MTAKPIMAWRKSPRLLVGSDDPAAVMDAIVAWMNDPDALYENGDARAQHTGSAWDVAGVEQDVGLTYTVCVRLQPPTTSTRKNQRVCLMGMATVAGAPTMIGSDVFANKNMYVCHVKGVTHDDEGDYTSFVDNPPYTGYNWTKWMGTKRNIACTAVHVYEGIEGIAFEFENQSNGDWPVGFCIAGDLLDTFGQGRAEADGGVYCCFASGYTADLNVAFWSSTTAGTFFVHTDSAGWHKWATLHFVSSLLPRTLE